MLADTSILRRADHIGVTLHAEMVTWELCVVRVEHGRGRYVVCIPGESFDSWLADFDAGRLDTRLTRLMCRPPRRSLRRVPASIRREIRHRTACVGIEHEFEVHHGSDCVDFRRVIGGLDLDGIVADPCDPLARRTATGVITADGQEAEIATHPITLGPGFSGRAAAAAADATESLRNALPAGHRLVGVSTHINVSWHVRRDALMARRWASVFAPALMLLMDRPTSPGLLVRPRPGRLELGGEYCTDERLAMVVAFAAASVRLMQTRWTACRTLALRVGVVPAVARFGWYVDRMAFGSDLYADGRSCPITRTDGVMTTAGAHLQALVELMDDMLRRCGAEQELEELRRTAAATSPLPAPVDDAPAMLASRGRRQ